ncbi:MAG: hypothetical protein JO057_26420, partial [Chloroflexi bacterium]|nr:hypothetical protein [Chloroflexota bacterium]
MPRRVNRRGFVRLSATSLAAAPLLLEACQSLSAPLVSSRATPAASTAGTNSVFPTYVPLTNGPKPDYPSIGPLYEDAFDNYPPNPAKAIDTPPGKGGRVDITTIALFPPPTP